jgi:hypothetical protein
LVLAGVLIHPCPASWARYTMHASTPTGTGDREPRRLLGGPLGSELPGERFLLCNTGHPSLEKAS